MTHGWEHVETPDQLPDDLVARYGSAARRAVRYRRSRRSTVRRGVARVATPLRDGRVWAAAAAVFLWTLLGLAVLGGISYAAVRWPRVVLLVLLPVAAILTFSLGVAVRIVGREDRVTEEVAV